MSTSLEAYHHLFHTEGLKNEQTDQAALLTAVWQQNGQERPGGSLYVERAGLVVHEDEPVFLKWRTLDLGDPQDRTLVVAWIQKIVARGDVPLERYDCLVCRTDGLRLIFEPHATRLLRPYHPEDET